MARTIGPVTTTSASWKVLARVVLGNPAGWPDFLLYGGAGGPHWYTRPCWPQYAERLGILGTTSIGVWRRTE